MCVCRDSFFGDFCEFSNSTINTTANSSSTENIDNPELNILILVVSAALLVAIVVISFFLCRKSDKNTSEVYAMPDFDEMRKASDKKAASDRVANQQRKEFRQTFHSSIN